MRIIHYFFRKETRTRKNIQIYLKLKSLKKPNFIEKIIIFFLYDRLSFGNGITIGKKCCISEQTIFPHPQNIVIGEGVKIGDNCMIYQDVTLGQKEGLYPDIGNNVTIFPGAKVIGGVAIGDNVVVGANSVVIKDIPANSVVAGVPAKVIDSKERQ